MLFSDGLHPSLADIGLSGLNVDGIVSTFL